MTRRHRQGRTGDRPLRSGHAAARRARRAGPRRRAARAPAAECRPRHALLKRIGIGVGADQPRDDRRSAWSSRSACSASSPRSARDRRRRRRAASRAAAEHAISPPAPSTDLPNGEMVQRFDSYIYRSARARCPRRRRPQLDAISADPAVAQADAGAGRYARPDCAGCAAADVDPPARPDRPLRARPAAYPQRAGRRRQDRRRAAGRRARRRPRGAWRDLASSSPAPDVAAFETQGRFIQSRYGEDSGSRERGRLQAH